MKTELLPAIGILAQWAGIVFAIRATMALARMIATPNEIEKQRQRQVIPGNAVIGAILLVVSFLLAPKGTGKAFPLVWFVMPFQAWLGLACAGMGFARLIQSVTGISHDERVSRLRGSLIFFGLTAVFAYWFKASKGEVTILRGGIPLSTETILALMALAVVACFAMAFAANSLATRGIAKTIAAQAMLLVGSVVFGIPFLFLVTTSFKEDRDMSAAEGIIWIPSVQDTVPYISPTKTVYEVMTKMGRIEGTIIDDKRSGRVTLDVIKPIAIRGTTIEAEFDQLKPAPQNAKVVKGTLNGVEITGFIAEDLEDGRQRVIVMTPLKLKDVEHVFLPGQTEPVRHVGLRTENYTEAIDFLPPETNRGLVYLKNTLILVVLGVVGTLLSSAIVAYAFSRLQFPGRELLFKILLSTMMLPGAVTLLPQFLIFRTLGWIDTLYPLWVPAFFGSAFNVFLLRQFFSQIPMELEDAAKMDGCSYIKTFWAIMLPQIKPALAVIAIWTFMGAWNNFMGPLIYINSPENMPLSYALQLFQGDKSGEPGLLMAFATLTVLPVLALFFFTQKYFIEGVTLSGLGGR